jgi:hypothetical protein
MSIIFCVRLGSFLQSLIAQGSQFPLRKPPGFHYDFFLLGFTTFIAGLIGVPAPNGLIPQAPIHTTSLLVMGHPSKKDKEQEEELQVMAQSMSQGSTTDQKSQPFDVAKQALPFEVPVGIIEQRVSNLAQGALCLVLLSGPFLHVLHLIPRGMDYCLCCA